MSFTLGIRYLCGWAMSSHPADRDRPEWPPHPDRVFMALAAGFFETDGDEEERAALEWLESQPPPDLICSPFQARSKVTSYVPVNDTTLPRTKVGAALSAEQVRAGLRVLPEFRSRQARQFPTAIPAKELVYLEWTTDIPSEHAAALARVCQKVTYIGHSASLVQVWLLKGDDIPDVASYERLKPGAADARHRLRVTGSGRLAHLKNQYELGQRPMASAAIGYGSEAKRKFAKICETVFDPNLIILERVGGDRIGLETALQLTEAVRGAILKYADTPVPEWVSGHQPDGSPSQKSHLALFPLPHVGRQHADGHLLGVAIALPRDVPRDERNRSLRNLLFDASGQPNEIVLTMGRAGMWRVSLADGEDRPVSLRTETWTADSPRQGAARWGTVTPIVFDRHPRSKDQRASADEIEDMIRQACIRIGLPELRDVILSPVSMFIGSPHAHRFPLLQRKGGGNLHHTHAILTFAGPTCGPILLGAGRYRGYGLCRPLYGQGGEE